MASSRTENASDSVFVWMVSVLFGRFYPTAVSLRRLFIYRLVSAALPSGTLFVFLHMLRYGSVWRLALTFSAGFMFSLKTTPDSESFVSQVEQLCTVKCRRAGLLVSPAASRQKRGESTCVARSSRHRSKACIDRPPSH